jgi:hypothetical protein
LFSGERPEARHCQFQLQLMEQFEHNAVEKLLIFIDCLIKIVALMHTKLIHSSDLYRGYDGGSNLDLNINCSWGFHGFPQSLYANLQIVIHISLHSIFFQIHYSLTILPFDTM